MALRSADSPREAQVHRTYTFGAAAAPAAGGWDPRPFARVAVEDAYVVRGARGGGGAGVGRLEGGVVPAAAAGALLGVRVNHTAVLSAAAAALVSDALLPGAFNGEARSALATHPTRGTNGNPSALLTLADGRAVALMAFDSVLRAHAVLSRGPRGEAASLADPVLALARGDSSYVSRWAVYYVADADDVGGLRGAADGISVVAPRRVAAPRAAAMMTEPASSAQQHAGVIGAPPRTREFDLVNQLRHDLGTVNVTLRGAGTVLALHASTLAAGGWSDPTGWDAVTIADWFRYQHLVYTGSDIPRLAKDWPAENCSRYTRNYCYGGCYAPAALESNTTVAYEAMLVRSVAMARQGGSNNDSRALLYAHPFLDTAPDAAVGLPPSAQQITPDGTPLRYADCAYAPEFQGYLNSSAPGGLSEYGAVLMGYKDKALDQRGFDGLYMDESIYSVSPQNFNPRIWDGRSGVLAVSGGGGANGTVARTFTDVTLAYAPLKLAIIDAVLARGGTMMTNCAPVTAEVTAYGVRAGRAAQVSFVETGTAINRLRWAQLYTPLGLAKPVGSSGGAAGDLDPAYANVTGELVDNLYASLDFGCVSFAYNRILPNASGWRDPAARDSVVRHAFPLTPQRLGGGFIVGRERVLTKVSGSFAPYAGGAGVRDAAERAPAALCVREFDRDGWKLRVRRGLPSPAKTTLLPDGGAEGAAFAVVAPDSECAGEGAGAGGRRSW